MQCEMNRSSAWGSRQRHICQHMGLRARASASLLPLHSLNLPSCCGLPYKTVMCPQIKIKGNFSVSPCEPHPIPHRWDRRQH